VSFGTVVNLGWSTVGAGAEWCTLLLLAVCLVVLVALCAVQTG
jgi:hypothetical protein